MSTPVRREAGAYTAFSTGKCPLCGLWPGETAIRLTVQFGPPNAYVPEGNVLCAFNRTHWICVPCASALGHAAPCNLETTTPAPEDAGVADPDAPGASSPD